MKRRERTQQEKMKENKRKKKVKEDKKKGEMGSEGTRRDTVERKRKKGYE